MTLEIKVINTFSKDFELNQFVRKKLIVIALYIASK